MQGISFRTKLRLTFGLVLALVLASASVTYWMAEKTSAFLERSRLAHTVLQLHQQLSIETNRLFKQLADVIVTGQPSDALAEDAAKNRLQKTLADLRSHIASEIAFVEGDEREGEKRELDHLAVIQRKTDIIFAEFKEVGTLIENGRELEAWTKLSRVLDESIDEDFNTLVEQAIETEQEEVREADNQAARLLELLTLLAYSNGALTLVIALVGMALLTRQFERPLSELLAGTRALTAGNLGHRIAMTGNGEFLELATSFNQMAEQLERHQRHLQNVHADLERIVSARMKELETAHATLKRQDAGRRQLLSDISHELRTPLTIIRGEAEIALRGSARDIDEYRTTLARIVDQAAHTARLVDDLLFVARADENQARLQMQPVALDSLLERLSEEARAVCDERPVHIETRLRASGAMVLGDPARLRQLFMILIENAVRYSKPHGAVAIELRPDPKGVVVRISDEGVGIAEDELDRVFDRFYRGENAIGVYPEGSGLGLSLAKAIVQAHAGEISVSSTLDRGTTVTVTLPTVRKLRLIA